MSWCITYPPEYSVTVSSAGGSPPPTTRLAPSFDGVATRVTTPAITLAGDYTFEFKIRKLSENNSFNGIAYDESGSSAAYIRTRNDDASGLVQFVGFATSDIRVPGISSTDSSDTHVKISASSGVLTVSFDDAVVFSGTQSGSAVALNTFGESSLSRVNARIYDIKLNDGSVHNYPFDDGWLSNPVIRNLGSAGNGTAINFLESTWEEIPA